MSKELRIHGPNVNVYYNRPTISIKLDYSSVVRNGEAVTVTISVAELLPLYESSYFGYTITTYASLDSGQRVELFHKPSNPSVWSSGQFKINSSRSIVCNTRLSTATINIYLQSNCDCSSNKVEKVAQWTIPVPPYEYELKFNKNGGDSSVPSQHFQANETIYITSQLPIGKSRMITFRSAYHEDQEQVIHDSFNRWSTDSSGTGATYFPGDTFSSSKDAELFAIWDYGNISSFPDWSHTGFIIDKWIDSQGNEVTSSTEIKSDMIVTAHLIPSASYAVYYKNTYNVLDPPPGTKIQGHPYTIASMDDRYIPTFTVSLDPNSGQVDTSQLSYRPQFVNWNTLPNGKGTKYDPGQIYNQDEQLTLYTIWNPCFLGELPQPTRPGYVFKGWYTTDGNPVSARTEVSSDLSLIAKWGGGIWIYTDGRWEPSLIPHVYVRDSSGNLVWKDTEVHYNI